MSFGRNGLVSNKGVLLFWLQFEGAPKTYPYGCKTGGTTIVNRAQSARIERTEALRGCLPQRAGFTLHSGARFHLGGTVG